MPEMQAQSDNTVDVDIITTSQKHLIAMYIQFVLVVISITGKCCLFIFSYATRLNTQLNVGKHLTPLSLPNDVTFHCSIH